MARKASSRPKTKAKPQPRGKSVTAPILMPSPFDLLREHYGEAPANGRGYSQLVNVGDLAVTTDVLPGIRIRRPTASEVDEIRVIISSYTDLLQQLRNPHETKLVREAWPTGPAGSWKENWSPLLPEQWRYVVLEHSSTNSIAHALAEASVLTPKHLEIGVEVGLRPLSATAGVAGRFINEAQHDDGAFLRFDDDDVAELAQTFERYQKHDDAVFPLRSVVADYTALRAIPRDSRLLFLGYIALLESLVAHSPNPTDPYQSLTRQVMKKLLLLDRRFSHSLPFDEFRGTDPETVLQRLYKLRSTVAHGRRPDFTKGDLKLLGNLDKATRFVAGATWRVMRQALEEPHLLADLHEC